MERKYAKYKNAPDHLLNISSVGLDGHVKQELIGGFTRVENVFLRLISHPIPFLDHFPDEGDMPAYWMFAEKICLFMEQRRNEDREP